MARLGLALLGAGRLGAAHARRALHLIRSVSHDPYPPSSEYLRGCGGQFADMAIHDIDVARFLTGMEIEQVWAIGAALGPRAGEFQALGDWDTTALTLQFASGALGSIVNSRQAGYGYDIHTDVLGDRGGLKIGYERHTPLTRYDHQGAHHDYVPYFPERFRSEEHTSELQSPCKLVCRLLLEKKKK